ncbi:MAG: PDZ domain-containing protein [Oscillospiraceae bacterium]|nr:PDZ domain-containing protein [Oscillospiraceae bacterium]
MGVYVAGVEKGGAAEAAGIKVGDLIVKMGDTNVTSLASLTPALKKYKVGDTTTVTVYRSGKLLELTLTFGEKPHGEVQLPQEETQEPTQSTAPENGDFKDWWDRFFSDGNN